MKILALESAAKIASVALCDDGRLIAEYTLNTGNTHSETLLPMAESLLKLTGHTVGDIGLFACDAGPGSFTGVRIGAATVKGLAFGRSTPCCGVSALETLAYNLDNIPGIICPVIDARRTQVYNALFSFRGGKITRLCADRIIPLSQLDSELAATGQPIYLVGDAYDLASGLMKDADIQAVPENLRLQSAYSVARLAYCMYLDEKSTTDILLTPDYLRPSEAERTREEKLRNSTQTEDK